MINTTEYDVGMEEMPAGNGVHFEKTVEWYFVSKCLDERSFGAPLAGNHEIAGDALLGSNNRFCLIEFKRGISELGTERSKFPAMNTNLEKSALANEACVSLVSDYGSPDGRLPPHALVYGVYRKGKKGRFLSGVEAQTYWGDWVNIRRGQDGNHSIPTSAVSKPVGARRISDEIGVSLDDFRDYLNRLITAKGGMASAGSGSSMYDLVVGVVHVEGNPHTVTMTLWEFARATNDSALELAFAEAHVKLASEALDDIRLQASLSAEGVGQLEATDKKQSLDKTSADDQKSISDLDKRYRLRPTPPRPAPPSPIPRPRRPRI